MSDSKIFSDDIAWFNYFAEKVIKQTIKEEIDEKVVLHWSLHGSRFLNIAYPESDFDITIVVGDDGIYQQIRMLRKFNGAVVRQTKRLNKN